MPRDDGVLVVGIGREMRRERKIDPSPTIGSRLLYVFMSIVKFRYLVTRDTNAFILKLNS